MIKTKINDFIKSEIDNHNFKIAKLKFLEKKYSDIIVNECLSFQSKSANVNLNSINNKYYYNGCKVELCEELNFNYNNNNYILRINGDPGHIKLYDVITEYDSNINPFNPLLKTTSNVNAFKKIRTIKVCNLQKKFKQLKYNNAIITNIYSFMMEDMKKYLNNIYNIKYDIKDERLKKLLIMA